MKNWIYDTKNKCWNFKDGGLLTIAYPQEDVIKDIDFSGINTTSNRGYNPQNINYIYKILKQNSFSNTQIAAVLANIIEESGGNPMAISKDKYKFQGLLQWNPKDRYKIQSSDKKQELDNQLVHFLNTYRNTKDRVSWTRGFKLGKYTSLKQAINNFYDDDLYNSVHGFTYGYIRPAGKDESVQNRYKVAKLIYDKIKNE